MSEVFEDGIFNLIRHERVPVTALAVGDVILLPDGVPWLIEKLVLTDSFIVVSDPEPEVLITGHNNEGSVVSTLIAQSDLASSGVTLTYYQADPLENDGSEEVVFDTILPLDSQVERVPRAYLLNPPVVKGAITLREKLEAVRAQQQRAQTIVHAHGSSRSNFRLLDLALESLAQIVDGYCSRCGLTNEKHVPHSPEDRIVLHPTNRGERQLYFEMLREQYLKALKTLTNEEILAMPIPAGKTRSTLLEREVQARIQNEPQSKTLTERLLTGNNVFKEDV